MNEFNLSILEKMVRKTIRKKDYYKKLKEYVIKNGVNLFLIQKIDENIYNRLRSELIIKRGA